MTTRPILKIVPPDIYCTAIVTRGTKCKRKRKYGTLCRRHYLDTQPVTNKDKITEDIYCVEKTIKNEPCKYKKKIGDLCRKHHETKEREIHCHDDTCSNKICRNKTCQDKNCRDKMCKEILKSKDPCPYKAKIGDLCTLHYNKKIEKEKATLMYENLNNVDSICTFTGRRRERCSRPSKMGTLCLYHHNFILKKEGKFVEQIDPMLDEKEVRMCNCPSHKSYGSPYIREKVPLTEFQRTEGNFDDLFELCKDCRIYGKNKVYRRRDRLRKLNDGKEIKDTKACQSLFHDIPGVSSFSRHDVPIDKFDYKSKNAKTQSKSCIDCREFRDERKRKYQGEKIEKSYVNGKFYCVCCDKTLELNQQSINMDGTLSPYCIECKKSKIKWSDGCTKHMKKIHRQIQKEIIYENECSCERCKCIILKPIEGTENVVELSTFEEGGDRYTEYEGETYIVREFLEKYENLLEYRTLEFDHLTEKEQRERGIIDENEESLKKKGSVSAMPNEYAMRKEAEKTQLLCCKCHLIVTISREKGKERPQIDKKYDYIRDLKIQTGCEICKFNDPNLLRYLEFDHLDPKTKIRGISEMVMFSQYSLEDLIEECKKCRILCKSCHKIHTDNQRKAGIIVYKKWNDSTDNTDSIDSMDSTDNTISSKNE